MVAVAADQTGGTVDVLGVQRQPPPAVSSDGSVGSDQSALAEGPLSAPDA